MKIKSLILVGLAVVAVGCKQQAVQDPLPSWNDTPVKQQIIEYLDVKAEQIPVEDRVAVFDMDGTIMCEAPLWCEMAVAANGIVEFQKENPEINQTEYYKMAQKLVENPTDSTVLNNWFVDGKNYLDSVVHNAFKGVDHEVYVDFAHKFLKETKVPRYGMPYAEAFYQPMLELIDYLKAKQFEVYLVSGSMQGVVWAVAPEATGLDRHNLIGTVQNMSVTYPTDGKASFKIENTIRKPKNNRNGKTVNIYNHCGKIPVMAVGNTTGDFGMFEMASTSPYPHLAILINHDDGREYIYEPWHGKGLPGWQDTLKVHNWLQADMSKEFKTVWMTKPNAK